MKCDKKRSYIMSRIRGRGTKPELLMKKFLPDFDYQPNGAFGNPDFINYDKRIVIFIDGCFWHCCKKHFRMPKSNSTFWEKKFSRNVIRDMEVDFVYKSSKWGVIRIWEHDIKFLIKLDRLISR